MADGGIHGMVPTRNIRATLLFQHKEKGLIGVAQTPKEKDGFIKVRMEPGASVTGRLVNADGKPRVGVDLEVWFRQPEARSWRDYSPERITTDKDGRFRLDALLPSYEFRLSDGKGEVPIGGGLRSGQTKNLGDVQVKASEKES